MVNLRSDDENRVAFECTKCDETHERTKRPSSPHYQTPLHLAPRRTSSRYELVLKIGAVLNRRSSLPCKPTRRARRSTSSYFQRICLDLSLTLLSQQQPNKHNQEPTSQFVTRAVLVRSDDNASVRGPRNIASLGAHRSSRSRSSKEQRLDLLFGGASFEGGSRLNRRVAYESRSSAC
jgi:hypothetical protein